MWGGCMGMVCGVDVWGGGVGQMGGGVGWMCGADVWGGCVGRMCGAMLWGDAVLSPQDGNGNQVPPRVSQEVRGALWGAVGPRNGALWGAVGPRSGAEPHFPPSPHRR